METNLTYLCISSKGFQQYSFINDYGKFPKILNTLSDTVLALDFA